jgi:hypothetical protein
MMADSASDSVIYIANTAMGKHMRKILFTAFAAAIILTSGVFGHRAEAMTLIAPAAMNAAAARVAVVQPVVSVCGSNGCSVIQTKKVVHHKASNIAANHP